MKMEIDLNAPITVQVELEFTNVCNAKCTACPRNDLPAAGMMSVETLNKILDFYSNNPNILNTPPEYIIAGGGEPLINKKAIDLITAISSRNLQVSLTTNATRITNKNAEQLANSGLEYIYISFWGIYKEEYERAMQLPFEDTLEKVKLISNLTKNTSTTVIVKWLNVPALTSTTQEMEEFWENLGIQYVSGYHDEWNRAGLNKEANKRVQNSVIFPNTEKKIWCSDLFFSDAYSWSGDCVLCCCNYFTSKQILLGNIHINPQEIAINKMQIIKNRPLPKMCEQCKLPRKDRIKRLSRSFIDELSKSEQQSLLDY
ncbi:MAG: radical SAM protein [Legionellales bacterium]|nr:radical SAM protein [Legionellales bacterium]